MLDIIIQNLVRFVLLLLIQVLLISNLNLSPYITPNIFPLFVLLLPFATPRWLLMLIGFFSGLMLDVFLGTVGMNAAATLLIAYLRPFLINIITPRGSEFEQTPNIFSQGLTWFLIYVSILVFIHHFFYLLIESGTFYNLLKLLLRVICSTALSMLFMFIGLYLFSTKKKRKV
jgi:rod shape-determining protein MreD